MLNDPSFIQLLKQGNGNAFTQLVEAYQHMVFNTVLSIVQQYEEAEDVSQEVFVQVYQSIKDFRGDAKLSTWMYRIAVTKALDWERKKKSKKRVNVLKNLIGIGTKEEEAVTDFHHPGIELSNKENAAVLFKALQQLPENQRLAFVLIKSEGLSYAEVSDILKTSVKSIEGLMHRAKENLRNSLQNYYSE